MLCLGITPDDHEWLQAHRDDVEVVAAYLHEHEIACALAHPFFAVAAPLTPRHRRRLAELFGIWEVRNGARDAELNLPAAIYIETHGGHRDRRHRRPRRHRHRPHVLRDAAAATPAEFLAHVRAGRVQARGDQGSAARWAHNAMALAVRALGRGAGGRRRAGPGRGAADGRARDERRPTRAAAPGAAAPTSARTTPARCCAPGSRGRARSSAGGLATLRSPTAT